MIDAEGFRAAVGIIVTNDSNRLLWAKRISPKNAWQFPQGGLMEGETPEQAMYRELHEELGLEEADVELLAESDEWFFYRLPKRLIRHHSKPLCIGQKQKWFLLRMRAADEKVRFDAAGSPEFMGFRWVSYWYPLKRVIPFKRRVYRMALKAFAPILFPDKAVSPEEEV